MEEDGETDDILRCALVETEWLVNQHLLKYVAIDSVEEPAFTPNDFLHGARQQRSRDEAVLVTAVGKLHEEDVEDRSADC